VAEETLVKENLDETMIQGGEALTRKLDELGWPVVAAFWYFERDENRWKLILASPRVSLDGPKKSYEAISSALSTLHQHLTALQFITVVPPEHPLVKTLALVARTSSNISGMRLSRITVDGQYIEDAYLYRVNVNPAAA
jgi:hypothetical protein